MRLSIERLVLLTIVLQPFICLECSGNLPPFFTEDLNNHVIAENTPVGTPIFTLRGVDPEKSELRYGIMGTDKLTVHEKTGVVTIAKPIDREIRILWAYSFCGTCTHDSFSRAVEDQLRVSVTVEDVDEGNLVVVKNVVQIADLNDNPVEFVNKSAYETVEVMEDIRVGSRVLTILLKDPDLTGLDLSLNCTPTLQSPEACQMFPIHVTETTSGVLNGEVRLGQNLDYNKRSLYQFVLTATDGEHVSSADVLIRVKDVQNTPPVFVGAMSGRVMEDAPVGTLAMIIEARDGDLGIPRNIKLTLLNNPGDYFQLDSKTGHLTTTRPLDRETLGSLLTLEVKAQELPRNEELMFITQPDIDVLQTVANVTVLIDDVNDFAPRFNQKEFWTEINENTPIGTPLPDLDIVVTDEDSGTFADFTLRIDGPLAELFDIEPKIVSGSARPTIRVKKAFDYENPNERKFLILIIAKNIEEPELTSTCTISVTTNDENDNRPRFSREVFTLTVPESAEPGTQIGSIVATDPDSKEYGNEGIVYQLVGSGNKKFSVNPKTGDISVADCGSNIADNHTVTVANCLDFETQKTYDLLYMASDSHKQDGFIHSIVPLQILLTDSNDNQLFFESKFQRTILENSRQFEPSFYIRAKDTDKTSIIAYTITSQSAGSNYFQIDEATGELSIRTIVLPPGNYSFNVSAYDGVFTATTPVLISVLDLNNNNPIFNSSMARSLDISEDAEIGTVLIQLQATDKDLENNGLVHYEIESGAFGYFDINEETGEIMLIKELDDRVKGNFELIVTAFDLGTPPLRTRTKIHVKVLDVYMPLPTIVPALQRAQVSESAKIGDFVTIIQTNVEDLGLDLEKFNLTFEFVQPMEARNLDNKAVQNSTMIEDWFHINKLGEVRVAAELAREMVNSVNLTVLLTSTKSRPGSRSYATLSITIFDVNQRSPMIEDVEIETYEELPPGMTILTLACEDPEGGQISNYFVDQGAEYVSIDNKTGEMKIKGRLDYEDRPMYNLTVVCVDSGVPQLSSTGTVMVSLLNINDNNPEFNQTSYTAEVDEHAPEGTVVTSVHATDKDGDVVYYDIEGSQYSSAFRIDRLGLITVSKEGTTLIDRETMKSSFITLGIRAKDSEHFGFTTIQIKVRDINDVWPKISIKNYHIGVHAPLRGNQELLKVTAQGGDQDNTDELRFKIHSGNDLGVFEVDSKSGIISAARAYDDSGEFRLVIEVTDKRGDTSGTDHYDRAGVFIQIFPGNFRKPEFKFPNRVNSTLPAVESDAAEVDQFAEGDFTKILGQVLAFDQDEGEAGELQFYFKDEDNLVTETEQFRIETETGVIHQIKPLDREEMNRYNLVVVAKDNGKPVSTESHEVLTIVIDDIDDNKSFFENREYNFTIKENSLENTFIGQVKARDDDDGRNAEIFYFLVATEENHHYIHNDIRVDIKSGAIFTNAILDHERMNAYLFFIRASASPMANRSAELMKMEDILTEPSVAIVRVKIEDLNDNSPRFTSREYYAGINSNAEPGREILTFESTDVDPSSQPYLQYSLLGAHLILDEFKSGGAVLPSPFRVDSNTGRLTISPTAMRRYAGGNNRFTVKVGVKETIPPFYQDTTQVKVWVVENSQEAILTIKTPPTEMLREELIEMLGNITGRLILVNKVTPHVTDDFSVNKAWSDVYVTAVDQKTNQIVPVAQFLQALDLSHDRLRKSGVPLELYTAVPAMGSTEKDGNFFFNDRESFDTAFAGLVALVALLCMGLATILAVCCCLNRMYSKKSDKSSQLSSSGMKYPLHLGGSIPGTPGMSRNIMAQQPDMIEDLATDNPLWTDHKMKTYEEQELTMQVASDFENSNGTEDGMSVDMEDGRHHIGGHHRQHSPQFSHAYATLHPHPPDYDNILGDDTIAVHL